MLFLENSLLVIQRDSESLTRNGILETQLPDFPDWEKLKMCGTEWHGSAHSGQATELESPILCL